MVQGKEIAMDEIRELAAKLEVALKEQRAIRGRAEETRHSRDELDQVVGDIVDALSDAVAVDNQCGCNHCGG